RANEGQRQHEPRKGWWRQKSLAVIERGVRSHLREQLVLQRQRIDVAPSVLEPDARADVDEGQVVVEDVPAQRHHHDQPGGDAKRDDQEPRQGDCAKVPPGSSIEPADCQPRSARGTGFRGSGPMYSDCGRIMRLLATCSSTCAVQPAARETAKVGVKYGFGSPIACRTPAE